MPSASTSPRAPLRVLIATGIYPPDVGGPATHVLELCSSWATEPGVNTTVVTLHDAGVSRSPAAWRVRSLRRSGVLAARLLRTILVLIAEARRADVIYATGLHLEAAVASVITGTPLVVKIPGDPVWERARRLGLTSSGFDDYQTERFGTLSRVGLMRLARSTWLRQSRLVVVPSEYLGVIARRWGVPPDRIRTIYNGHRNQPMPMPVELASGLEVAYIGRLVAHKRVDFIVRAMGQIPRVRLNILGSGPEEERLRRLVQDLDLEQVVQFHGHVLPDDVASVLRRVHVVVNAAVYEGLPHSVLEALAAGRPVVASNAGGTGELVRDGENGVLLPLDAGPAAYARAICDVTRDAEHYGALAAAAAQSAASWSVEAMVVGVRAALEEAASAGSVR